MGISSVTAVAASAVLKPPETIAVNPPQVKNDTPTAEPAVQAALPPGQGTRIDQLA